MSRIEYALQAIAWGLLGVLLTLTWQRLMNYYREKQKLGRLPPVSTTAYFGTVLVIISLISGLFSIANKIESDKNKSCQDNINKHNVAVANSRWDLQLKYIVQLKEANSLQQITAAAVEFYKDSNSIGNSVPVITCSDNPDPDLQGGR